MLANTCAEEVAHLIIRWIQKAVLLPFLVLAATCIATASQGNCLRLAFYTEMPGGEPLAKALAQAYEQAGVCITIVDMPLARAGQLIISGELDADIARTQAFIDKADGNVIAVPTPVFTLQIVAITLKDSQFEPTQPSDLKGRTIGVKSGVHWIAALGDDTRIMDVHQTPQLLTMVERARLEVALVDTATLGVLRRLGHGPSEKLKVSAPIIEFPIYHVLNARHASLVPKLDAILQEIQSARLIEKTMEKWFENQLADAGTGDETQ